MAELVGEAKIPLEYSLKDVLYSYSQLEINHNSAPIFRSMDLSRVGILGHSLGGGIAAKLTISYPNLFHAGASLDIMNDPTYETRAAQANPFMHYSFLVSFVNKILYTSWFFCI